MPIEMDNTTLNCHEKITSYIETIAKRPKLGINYFLLMDDKSFIINGKKLTLLPDDYRHLLAKEDFMVYVNPATRKVLYYAFDIDDVVDQTRANEEEGEIDWNRVEFHIYSFLTKNMKELTHDPFPYQAPKQETKPTQSYTDDDDDGYAQAYLGGYWHGNRAQQSNYDWNAAYKEREAFYDKLNAYMKTGRVSMAVDFITDDIERMCKDGKFESLDTILRLVEFSKLNIPLMFGIVEATKAYKEKLRERKEFIGKVKTHLSKFRPEKIETLMWELDAA